MIAMHLELGGDGVWPDLPQKEVVDVQSPLRVAVLDKGMASGQPSVGIRFDLPDGKVVIAQTSARLFVAAGRAIAARYPDLLTGDA